MALDPERIEDQSQLMASTSEPRLSSDALSESSSSAATADTPDRTHPSNSSPNSVGDGEIQSPASLRSEEYRQLFRLPADEVLIEDFNCACQENILIQGHMYLFLHHICFYSNIFGFETKKMIPLREVTGVKRAKTAGIFPNAIEIIAGEKRHFFGSFLSRDEAFKLINDGWLQHCNGVEAITEQETSESSSHDNGLVVIEKVKSFKCTIEEPGSADRDDDIQNIQDPEVLPIVEDDIVSTPISELNNNLEQQDAKPDVNSESFSSGKTWTWKEENSNAPKIPEYYTMVAESKFPIKVKDFFNLFFSEESINFVESFHGRCGDKDFKCTSWSPHNQFGHTRNVEFQHPIKIYFGAKFGSCKEVQKFRVYRNSCLVIETTQEIDDVPYGDYFRVEGLWELRRDSDESKECCDLRVYVNVAFSKKTVFKGKIVQSTIEECREAYALWISMAHELLKKKNLEKREDDCPASSVVENAGTQFEMETKTEEAVERAHEADDHLRTQMPDTVDVKQTGNHIQGNMIDANNIASVLRESMTKFWTSLKTQSHLPPLLVITFAVIILMQLSIVVLLARPQKVYVISPSGYVNALNSGDAGRSMEVIVQLEKRIHHLKHEMLTVETQLERMNHEHALLKAQLKDLGKMGMHR